MCLTTNTDAHPTLSPARRGSETQCPPHSAARHKIRAIVPLAAAICTFISVPARADPVGEFFSGKQIKFVIGSAGGGGYESYSRLLIPYLSRQIGRERDPDYLDIPLMLDLAATPADRQILELVLTQQVMAWPLVAPPGVPADRIMALRNAFEATMRDPDFLTEAARQKLIINPVSGEKIGALLDRVYAMPKDLLERVAALSERN
jgi:hypothetical protein